MILASSFSSPAFPRGGVRFQVSFSFGCLVFLYVYLDSFFSQQQTPTQDSDGHRAPAQKTCSFVFLRCRSFSSVHFRFLPSRSFSYVSPCVPFVSLSFLFVLRFVRFLSFPPHPSPAPHHRGAGLPLGGGSGGARHRDHI